MMGPLRFRSMLLGISGLPTLGPTRFSHFFNKQKFGSKNERCNGNRVYRKPKRNTKYDIDLDLD